MTVAGGAVIGGGGDVLLNTGALALKTGSVSVSSGSSTGLADFHSTATGSYTGTVISGKIPAAATATVAQFSEGSNVLFQVILFISLLATCMVA